MSSLKRLLLIVAVGGLMHAVLTIDVGADSNARSATLVLGVGFALLTAWLVGKLFSLVGLPKLTGYLATGIVSGPAVLAYLDGETVSGMGLVNGMATSLIALTAGSEMAFRTMRPLFRTIGWISLLGVLATAIGLGGLVFVLRDYLAFLRGMETPAIVAVSAVVGVVVVAQSPAVVVAIRAETGADGPVSRTALGVVVVADLVVIVLFAVLSSVANAVLAGTVDVGATAGRVAWELFGSLGIGAAIGAMLVAWLRFVGDRGLDLFVLATCFVSAEVGRSLHLDPLLLMLAAGMFVENVAQAGERLRHAFEDASLPVYILFFTVAGASIHLDVIPTVAVPATVLVIGRAIGLLVGARAGAKIAGAPPEVQRFAGFGLLPQAGLAIALSMLFARTFPQFGEEASALTLGIVAINEILAPAIFRAALVRSGEAQGPRVSVPGTIPAVSAPPSPAD